jgi:NNP family nitrate/nitrite transporter-like MFS transporter
MPQPKTQGSTQALVLSTLAFTACFAVWTIFSIIGIRIRQELGLSESALGLLVATPILTGSLSRVVLGVLADRYGGRSVFAATMLAAAVATVLLTIVQSYPEMLVAALGVGIAGGSFAVGVSYVSRWYPVTKQGAALTSILAPFALVAYGWHAVAQIWAGGLVLIAAIYWFAAKDDPVVVARRRAGVLPPSAWLQLEPLKNVQVWRFALYYFFVFGAFVTLALWLPHYLVSVYALDIRTAGVIAAFFSVPASLCRAYGGRLSDTYGARRVLYWTFLVSIVATFILSYPPTDYIVHSTHGPITFHLEMGVVGFAATVLVLGFFMALGAAAVYKHIPVYYPDSVGSVGGLVGMIGGLGGFVMPILFGALLDLTGLWTSCFMALFLVVVAALTWMHLAIRHMEKEAPVAARLPPFPEMLGMPEPVAAVRETGVVLADWRPEEPAFWAAQGRRIARRNLCLSIPALLLSFAVWQVWSVVVAKLPLVGFRFTTDQLFWLAALPGLSGATLRIFYSFMVPVFGGRLWTTLTTWSLMIPVLGIGLAVQNPNTPYVVLLALALLCGFGGGNFASSMANISFFFPRAEKGNALALNAGLGNLGVSVVQLVVPLAITASIFGWLGGPPEPAAPRMPPLWLQNAGFVFVPFIAASAFAAWFGMNDIASARASFREQAVIFQRRHNWIMCWLYTGTFGSFIGYSAGFPLLAKTLFPEVNALQFAFLGPLVGALARSGTGWLADRYGGARVTVWVFAAMTAGAAGVLWFIGMREQPHAFWGFFASFLFLFLATGVGNASTFQMIPAILAKDMPRLLPDADPTARRRQVEKESAAITGFTSAVAAFGAFFIPKSYGTSIALTGGPEAAIWCFLGFYVTCIAITWAVYDRRGGLLHDVERGRTKASPRSTQAA